MLFPDKTVVVQFFIFLVTYLVLRKTLFQPYLDALEKRDAATGGTGESTADMDKKIETLAQELEDAVEVLRDEGGKLRHEVVAEASAKRDGSVNEAQAEASKIKGSSEDEVASLRKDLESQLQPIRAELVDAITIQIAG